MSDKQFHPYANAEEKIKANGAYYLPSLFKNKELKKFLYSRKSGPFNLTDVGCGNGFFLSGLLQELRWRWGINPSMVTGIDLIKSPENIFDRFSNNFNFIQLDLRNEKLPFEDRSVDFLCCNHVLEHLYETEKLVREFYRVLKPDGFCIISVPNLAAWINRITFLFAGQPLGSEIGTEKINYGIWPYFIKHWLEFTPAGHIRFFTPRGLDDLTEYCGFRKVGWWPQSYGPIARLGKWAGRNIGIILVPK